MATTNVEAFSISHAAILDGSDGTEETDGDIYGVREGSLELQIDSYDNTGDDAVLSTWYWFTFANVTVTQGYISLKLVALLSGEDLTSSGVAPADYYDIPIWTDATLNQPTRPMLVRCPSKDENGVIRVLDIILYKVQFQPMSFDGPSYKAGLLVNYSGRAVVSVVDEAGDTVPRAIGRLVSSPAS